MRRRWPTAPEPRPPRPLVEFYATLARFPLARGVVSRWLLLSVGLTPASLILVAGQTWPWYRFGRWPTDMGWFIVFSTVALPVALLVLWAFAYASSMFFCALEGTAAGADRIESWPDPDWTDWLGQLARLSYVIAVAGAFSFALGWCVGQAAAWLAVAGAIPRPKDFGMAFDLATTATMLAASLPVVLLSTQESSCGMQPVTWRVWRSLDCKRLVLRSWTPLLMCSFGFMLALDWRFAVRLQYAACGHWLIAGLLLGPQLAAGILIYARLLGRLAWEINESTPLAIKSRRGLRARDRGRAARAASRRSPGGAASTTRRAPQ